MEEPSLTRSARTQRGQNRTAAAAGMNQKRVRGQGRGRHHINSPPSPPPHKRMGGLRIYLSELLVFWSTSVAQVVPRLTTRNFLCLCYLCQRVCWRGRGGVSADTYPGARCKQRGQTQKMLSGATPRKAMPLCKALPRAW